MHWRFLTTRGVCCEKSLRLKFEGKPNQKCNKCGISIRCGITCWGEAICLTKLKIQSDVLVVLVDYYYSILESVLKIVDLKINS